MVLSDQLGAHHPLSPVINLGIRHPRKKQRRLHSLLACLHCRLILGRFYRVAATSNRQTKNQMIVTVTGGIIRVVPSKIPNLERKRGQCQDSWVCPSETDIVAERKVPCRIFGSVTIVIWLYVMSRFRFC